MTTREEIARELQDKYENKNYYRMADPKTPILINKYEKIADWHIAELEKAKREARVGVEQATLNKCYEHIQEIYHCDIGACKGCYIFKKLNGIDRLEEIINNKENKCINGG